MNAMPFVTYRDLVSTFFSMDDGATGRDVVSSIVGWVERNSTTLVGSPYADYRRDVDRIKRRVSEFKPSDVMAMCQFLRDLMEELVVVEVDKTCIRCGESYMLAYSAVSMYAIVYQCVACGFSCFSDGSDLSGEGVRFLTEQELVSEGFVASG
jgi:predicted RNA-binding Zn-ribbon protein involved in translation (DUF1610 family)